MNERGWVEIPNTVRRVLPRAFEVGAVDPNEQIEVSVYLRRSPRVPGGPLLKLDYLKPALSRVKNYEAIDAAFSAEDDDLGKVEAFARAHGLEVLDTSAVKRRVALRGT